MPKRRNGGEQVQQERQNGTVVRIMQDKGFGFLKGDDGVEYFFHRSAVRAGWESLQTSQAVSFIAGQGEKGPRAEQVELE